MHRILLSSAATAALVAGLAVPASAEVFNRIASFPVNENIPADMGQDSESSS